jgi:anti-sigma regulatory factor (Ser/Thr protein kinase)
VRAVVSELVNNAVVHGPAQPIRLRLRIEPDGRIVGEVVDGGDGKIAIRELGDDPISGGYGLRVVDSLTSAWGVHEGSTHVWFEFAPGVRAGASPR